jgi:hypothetical protein
MGYAVSLVALRRFEDAREQLNEGMKLFPERPALTHYGGAR